MRKTLRPKSVKAARMEDSGSAASAVKASIRSGNCEEDCKNLQYAWLGKPSFIHFPLGIGTEFLQFWEQAWSISGAHFQYLIHVVIDEVSIRLPIHPSIRPASHPFIHPSRIT
ncbi:unnamed protein product [Protopolystoma xenopodis]|uniref:Uncharacterized protein n=1 Tax=Protopolystoma xenopodis TaxID=117903 RepID=A0A3S5B837_9PLAT|nr:unnamed protein product [Protopolystoma xenopodis]